MPSVKSQSLFSPSHFHSPEAATIPDPLCILLDSLCLQCISKHVVFFFFVHTQIVA